MTETLSQKLFKQNDPDNLFMTSIRIDQVVYEKLKPTLAKHNISFTEFVRNCMEVVVKENE
jgi:hypothetical protein